MSPTPLCGAQDGNWLLSLFDPIELQGGWEVAMRSGRWRDELWEEKNQCFLVFVRLECLGTFHFHSWGKVASLNIFFRELKS
jgi:hypothetical protein